MLHCDAGMHTSLHLLLSSDPAGSRERECEDGRPGELKKLISFLEVLIPFQPKKERGSGIFLPLNVVEK